MPTRHVLLMRGINVGKGKRIAMPALREMLEGLGYADVRTLLQSGNAAVTTTTRSPARVSSEVEAAILDTFGLEVKVVVRSRAQLEAVVAADPFGDGASNPSLYYVGFRDPPFPAGALDALDPADYEPERFALRAGTLYVWYPGGSQKSALEAAIGRLKVGGVLTMRNWRTVGRLRELAAD